MTEARDLPSFRPSVRPMRGSVRSLLHLGVLSLLLIGGVAGTAAAQSPPTAIDRLLGDPAWANSVVWNPTRPLRWEDFQAPVQPPHTGAQVASTWSGLAYAFQCDETRLEYAVLALFQPGESGSSPDSCGGEGRPNASWHTSKGILILPKSRCVACAPISPPRPSRVRRRKAPSSQRAPSQFAALTSSRRAMMSRLEHGIDDGPQARWLAWIRAALDTLAYAGRPTVSAPVLTRASGIGNHRLVGHGSWVMGHGSWVPSFRPPCPPVRPSAAVAFRGSQDYARQ